ncbi:S-ribosylhomocysteine lyase [Kocuria coralli]|uniref:S-ribosylhomocysteine lyase n=1 Tax=Kocuria coralli TaxID=1461025 RepID=A0A5J5KZB5_9MICC|nr:S-ribosylhomocysteine lyase [Kocuria coralli]KAA9394912.1 S-ribosylhomocysteine lyase [Kocuria coralli]
MADVESFTLDHTTVTAPYVRLIASEHGPGGDVISNFDLRFVQPNEGEIPTAALHTIEHLLASLLRDRIDGVIDCSPFGCRTGFHLIVWGEPTVTDIVTAVRASLRVIIEDTAFDDVPGLSAVECGNYRDHSLHGAKEWSARILEAGISLDAFERVGV